MITRFLQEKDIPKVKAIHEKYYEKDFIFPDFTDLHYLPPFAIVNSTDEILLAGGVRTILESVLITNKDFSPRERREALLLALELSIMQARSTNYNNIHAFIEENSWEEQLKKYGFSRCKGSALYLPTGL